MLQIYGYLFWVLRYYFQKITYKVTEPNKDDKIHVNTPVGLRDVGLGAHGENTYIFKVVLPPDCLLPNFTQCGLFSVQYEYKVRRNNFKYMFQIHAFQVTAKLSKWHNNLVVNAFPKVGHIPLGASNLGSPYSSPAGQYSAGWVGGPGPLPSAPLLGKKFYYTQLRVLKIN